MAPVSVTGCAACRKVGARRQTVPNAHVANVLCVFVLNIYDAFFYSDLQANAWAQVRFSTRLP